MTMTEVAARLRTLERYKHRVCYDGDGHIDDWADTAEHGEYVLWDDVLALAEELEQTQPNPET